MARTTDEFRSKKELLEAIYHARLILRRKTATAYELRCAAEKLNKAVKTLNHWLNNANYHNRCRAEDRAEREVWKRLNSVNRDSPLIPLSFKE